MIKINLLESITERQAGTAVVVERKVASPVSKLLLMSLAVGALLIAITGWDIVSTQMAKSEAEKELVNQQEIARQLEAVMKEQKELEAKITNIDTRIGAIKKLRASQAGPSAVLESLRERISMTPGIYLDSVEQKGEQLEIKGNSPDEMAVTQFGRSLEFSSGLFSNLGIETQRKDIGSSPDPNAAKSEIVNFTIRCAYTPSKSGNLNAPTTANSPNAAQPTTPGAQQSAANQPPAPNGAPQVAKN